MKFVIDFKDHLTEEQITSHIKNLGGSIVKTFSFSNKTYIVEIPNAPDFDDTLHEHIFNDAESALKLLNTTIMLDQTWGTTTVDGPKETISTENSNDWWKNYIVKNPKFDQPEYEIEKRGKDVVVYVLDSGCEISHDEFTNRPVENLFSFNGNFTDTNGHGTAIASVITGNTCGVSDATVKVVKIFQAGTPTLQSDLMNALDSIYNDFVQNSYSCAVINCSWTISKNSFIESKLQILINMGLIVVAAAGNNGTPIQDVTPASMNTVLTIGSFNQNLVPSDFSNYTGTSSISLSAGETNYGELDGWAPGENIYCAGLNNSYGHVAGTSIAAGIQSAACAYNLTTFKVEYDLNRSYTAYVGDASLSRKNLLDLSDSKYSSSKNAICTLHDEVAIVEDGRNQYTNLFRGYSSTHLNYRICDPRKYKVLEILGDLPAGISIDDITMVMGIIPEVSTVELHTVPARLADNNNETYEFDLNFIFVPNTFNIETDSTGDPVLDLKLQSVFCADNPCEDINGCINNCGGAQCVLDLNKFCSLGYFCFCNY